MEKNKQNQKVGDHSTSLQVGRDMHLTQVNQGVSYADAKEIALDVFRMNFHKLSSEAEQIALTRVEKFTDELYEKFHQKGEEIKESFNDPDMQYAIYTAQKEYARNGDVDTADTLMSLLIHRSEVKERSIRQIALNESISVVPKLTNYQLDLLSIIFLLKHARSQYMNNLDFLMYYMKTYFSKFLISIEVESLTTENNYCFEHLQYTGCGTINDGYITIEGVFLQKYSQLFSNGFTKSRLNEVITTEEVFSITQMCFHDKEKLQFNVSNIEELELKCQTLGFEKQEVDKIILLHKESLMNDKETNEFLSKFHHDMGLLVKLWNNSKTKHFSLTSVGIAIGHANIQRKTGIDLNLSTWLK